MYSFQRFAARRDRTGTKDHPPHMNPHPPRTMVDGGALGPGCLCSNLPGEQIRVVLVSMPPECRTGNPGSTPGLSAHIEPSAALRNSRGSAHKQGGSWRTYPPPGTGLNPLPPERSLVSPGRNPGLSAHVKPSARAHQAEGAGCISPPAALAAVGLPGCRRAGAEVCTVPFDPAARTAFTPLPAPEFERCRFSRPPQDPPSIMQT